MESRSPCVIACSLRARRAGVRAAMPLAEARTLIPSGWFALDDPEADIRQLKSLAQDCQRFSPTTGVEHSSSGENTGSGKKSGRPESIFLDATGFIPDNGELLHFCEQITRFFKKRRHKVRIAVAATFGAAWAASHAAMGWDILILDPARLRKSLAPLPVWGLRLPQEMLTLLEECGLKTIGQVLRQARPSLLSRFGSALLSRIDQALGDIPELLEPEPPPRPIKAEASFEYSLETSVEILAVLHTLLVQVIAEINRRRLETQHLRVSWKTDRRETGEWEIRLIGPTAKVDRFVELAPFHLERQALASGIVWLEAEAIPCPPRSAKALTLFDEIERSEAEFFRLIERLTSRLGSRAVLRGQLLPEFQPERIMMFEPWLVANSTTSPRGSRSDAPPKRSIPRPLRLLLTPAPIWPLTAETAGVPLRFRWDEHDHTVARFEGPERVETGWWHGPMIQRDYYRVETSLGTRLWMFQDLRKSTWFIHGLFE